MAKITKKTTAGSFDLDKFKSKFAPVKPSREQGFYDFPNEMKKELGLQGVPICGTTQILGYSDTGKTSLITHTAMEAIKRGDLPVFLITENKFSFEHAILMGLPCELTDVVDESTGEVKKMWDGDFIFKNDFENLEEIFDFMRLILDAQISGELPRNVVFLIDSIGSLHGKRQAEGAGGNMHDAKTISDNYKMDLAGRIQSTKFLKYSYTATSVIVNQCYPSIDAMGPTTIAPYGGNGIYYSADVVLLYGGQAKASAQNITATYKGRRIAFGKRVRVSIKKNHVNGISIDDGKVAIVPHGIISATNESIGDYKKAHIEYLKNLFRDYDSNIDGSEIDIELTDDNEVDI